MISEATQHVGREFICAGRAVFTVANPSGERYTYRVARKEATERYSETFFVSLLTGPDNANDYTYLGILEPETGDVRLTPAGRFNAATLPCRVIRWALARVWSGQPLPDGYAIHHEGKCGRCGRALTVPSSIDSGIGPECQRIMEGG